MRNVSPATIAVFEHRMLECVGGHCLSLQRCKNCKRHLHKLLSKKEYVRGRLDYWCFASRILFWLFTQATHAVYSRCRRCNTYLSVSGLHAQGVAQTYMQTQCRQQDSQRDLFIDEFFGYQLPDFCDAEWR